MTREMTRENKNADASNAATKSNELTPDEIAYVKRRSGVWPRVMGLTEGACNVQPPTSNLVAKTPAHLEAEAKFAAAEQRVRDAAALVATQEKARGHVTAPINGMAVEGSEPYRAPAYDLLIESQSLVEAARTARNRHDSEYAMRQRRVLTGLPEAPEGIIARAARALGLDGPSNTHAN